MVFAPNNMGDLHRDIIDDIHEVEAGGAIGSHENEVALFATRVARLTTRVIRISKRRVLTARVRKLA